MPVEGEAERGAALPTADLARDALRELRELVALEVALARDELQHDVGRAKVGGVAIAIAGALATAALAVLLVAVATAFDRLWIGCVVLGAGGLLMAVVVGYAGYRALPRRPASETRRRLRSDVEHLKERVA
jgi:hypothetical protein